MGLPFLADAVRLGATAYFLQGAAAPNAGGGVAAPLSSLYYQTSTFTIWHKVGAADTNWVNLRPQDMFGDGSDGDLTVAAPTTTITRTMYYGDLNVQAAGVFVARGTIAFVRGTLTIDVGGIISLDGGAGAAIGTAGVGAPSAAGNAGGAGINGGAGGIAGLGGNGGAATLNIQGFTGAGGNGGAGSVTAGGTGGTVTALALNLQGNPRDLVHAAIGTQAGGNALTRLGAAAGGGGGGGDGVNSGGGGGGGGGCYIIMARSVVNNGTIRALGGNGGTPAAGQCGGGGGGGGGLVVIGRHAYAGNLPSVLGGTKGNGVGAGGVNGVDGSPGIYVPVQL